MENMHNARRNFIKKAALLEKHAPGVNWTVDGVHLFNLGERVIQVI